MAGYSRCRLKNSFNHDDCLRQPLILIIFERFPISIYRRRRRRQPEQASIRTWVEKETLIEFTRLRTIYSMPVASGCALFAMFVLQAYSYRVLSCVHIQASF